MTTQNMTEDCTPSQEQSGPWCRDHQHRAYDFDEALELIRGFHGHAAPGMALGVKMVSHAMDHLPEDILFDAISETSSCLPDAVQLLTPCTIGNSWLKIRDFNKYAVALYDKYSGDGVRVFLDPAKLKLWPEFHTWFYKRKEKKEQDRDRLLHEIHCAGAQVLTLQQVRVRDRYIVKQSKGSIATCPICKEAFPAKDGAVCRGCRGESPYRSGNENNG